jgi:hypothetical protein
MARSYPYGKVTTVAGTVVSERFERPMVDCGYCSTQFAARTARAGVSTNGKSEGHRIRALGGRAHWAGSNASEQRIGAKKALAVDFVAITKGAVLNRVLQGFAVTVALQYIKLPGYLKVQTNDFGHCSTLYAARKVDGVQYIGYFDPLYEQGSSGTWTKWADIDQALWDGGHNTTVVRYVPPTPTPTPPTEPDEMRAFSVLPGTAGMHGTATVLQDDVAYIHLSDAAPSTLIKIPKGTVLGPVYPIRLAEDINAGNGDRRTGFMFGDPPSFILALNVDFVPAAGGPTDAQRLTIRKAEYERVVRGSIIQPPPIPE